VDIILKMASEVLIRTTGKS